MWSSICNLKQSHRVPEPSGQKDIIRQSSLNCFSLKQLNHADPMRYVYKTQWGTYTTWLTFWGERSCKKLQLNFKKARFPYISTVQPIRASTQTYTYKIKISHTKSKQSSPELTVSRMEFHYERMERTQREGEKWTITLNFPIQIKKICIEYFILLRRVSLLESTSFHSYL